MSNEQIHLSDEARAHIAGIVGAGNYGDSSDYIEALICEDRLTRNQLNDAFSTHASSLEQMALDALDGGDAIPMDAKYWQEKRTRLAQEFRPQ